MLEQATGRTNTLEENKLTSRTRTQGESKLLIQVSQWQLAMNLEAIPKWHQTKQKTAAPHNLNINGRDA